MTKTITLALTAVSLALLSAFAANEAKAHPGHLAIRATIYECSIAPARVEYRGTKKRLEHAAADSDFAGKRIARHAIADADEILRTPTDATCEARVRRYTDATRVLRKALRKLELRAPKVEPQQFRLKLTAYTRVR